MGFHNLPLKNFFKYEALGNDFIIFDHRQITFSPSLWEKDAIANLCHRNLGVGADGLILLLPGDDGYDAKMCYFNADGIEVGMCGNGLRCIVHFINYLKIAPKNVQIGHQVKTKNAVYVGKIDNRSGAVSVLMNECYDINLHYLDKFNNQIDAAHSYYINTGVPHSLFYFAQYLPDRPIIPFAPSVRYHPAIVATGGTNVSFLEPLQEGENIYNLRTYERGVEAETWSCGTAAVAATYFLLSLKNDIRNGTTLHFQTKGGRFNCTLDHHAGVWLSGEVHPVFRGSLENFPASYIS